MCQLSRATDTLLNAFDGDDNRELTEEEVIERHCFRVFVGFLVNTPQTERATGSASERRLMCVEGPSGGMLCKAELGVVIDG